MKVIFSIAKNEFRYLFYSPIAWFVLIVFLIQCAFYFSGEVYNLANIQDVSVKNMGSFGGFDDSLTKKIFLTTQIFDNILHNLFLFIPILTMGLISREVNNGTAALLYSSPVNMRRVVLGKYLGIMMYNLLLVGIVGIFLVTGAIEINKADYGPLFSAALSFYLLVCAYSALGMFMSSLTNYQIVSALATFIAIFLLTKIGGLWQRYDFVRDLTYFLSLQNRTSKMLFGLIVSRDVIYFLLVAGMFMAFTLIRLRNSRESISRFVKTGRYLAVILVVLSIGYISSRPALTGYWDTTATKRNTIHPKTQAVLKEFNKDSTLEITLYTNLLGIGRSLSAGLPETRNTGYLATLWDPYLRFKPDIRFKYEYYYDYDSTHDDGLLRRAFRKKPAKQMAAEIAEAMDADLSMYRSPEEMRKLIDLNPENYRLVMQVKYQGRTAFLRTFNDRDFWPNEMNMIAALKRVLGTDMPAVGFVTGGYERNIFKTGEREYGHHAASKAARYSLVNIGFDVDTVNLSKQDIPNDLTALVLADPKVNLSQVAMEKITNYIDKGGNLMVSGEPGKQHVVNPLLLQAGVQLMNGQILQPTYHETPDKVVPYLTPAAAELSEALAQIKKRKPGNYPLLVTPGTTGITLTEDKGFKATVIAATLVDSTWLKAGPVVIDSTLPPFSPAEGDLKEPSFTTIQQLTRKINGREQRMLITGDADFSSNRRLGDGFNSTFMFGYYSWLTNNHFPVFMFRKDPEDLLMNIGERAAYYQKIIFVWVLPALIFIGGTVLLIRRKRK